MLSLTFVQISLALTAALAAAFVRGLAGFGLAILLVPVLGLAIPPAEAVVVANVVGLLIGLTDIRAILGQSEATAKLIAVIAVLATPLGVVLLAHTNSDHARLIIAVVAVVAFVLFLMPQRPAHVPGPGLTGFTGLVCGLLTGFAGMPGPPVVPYYLGRMIEPRVARASMMLIFLATSFAGVASALVLSPAGPRAYLMGLLLFPAILLGNWIGNKAFGRISPLAWRVFTGAVLAASAFGAIAKLL